MEQVCRRSDVNDLPVRLLNLASAEVLLEGWDVILIIVGHLQEALDPAGGVLGSLAFVTVGKQHCQTRLLQPLMLARRNELVNHDLGCICEVTKLRLPDHQGMRILVSVAQLEAKDGVLSKNGIASDERLLWPQVQVVQETIGVAGLLVSNDAVPMRESPTLHILPCDAYMGALEQEGAVGQCLGGGPINCGARFQVLLFLFQLSLEAVVQGEAIWGLAQPEADLLEQVDVQAGWIGGCCVCGFRKALPLRGNPLHGLALVGVRGCKGFLMRFPNGLLHLVQLCLAGDP
mmetsp:Transcript_120545/g.312989  ORF Transcript_120545/g.312989 Transcript_120545/m.312989 type:complete len:289 (-) Transcript_120545:632-1498(-)